MEYDSVTAKLSNISETSVGLWVILKSVTQYNHPCAKENVVQVCTTRVQQVFPI